MTLVATNVAARGLDIDDVQLIIQVSFMLLHHYVSCNKSVVFIYSLFLKMIDYELVFLCCDFCIWGLVRTST